MGEEKKNSYFETEDLQSAAFPMCVHVNIHKYIFICYSQFKVFLFYYLSPCIYIKKNVLFLVFTCYKDVVFLSL